MKTFRNTIMALAALLGGFAIAACSDANEYEDAQTNNPSWVDGWTDSTKVSHPTSLSGTNWVRATGIKTNAYGEEVQGFVESVNFVTADSVKVKMSEGTTKGTWTDESNTEAQPYYEYSYSSTTGRLDILKLVRDDKGNISKSAVFVGIATSGNKEIITLSHFGDTPAQTYLVKQ
jgi:hypothetical protein